MVALAFSAVACGDGSEAASGDDVTTTVASAPSSGGEVVREILGRFPTPQSPGYEQILMEVTVPPGAELAAHTHPGFEIARIVQGDLTYTILEGIAEVGRGGAEQPTEQVSAPAEIVLSPGDTVYEPTGMHHMAANRGAVEVVILLASLIEIGQPIAIAD